MNNLFLFHIILILFSCSKKDNKWEELGGLEKIDSIQVPITPNLIFQDLDSNSGKVLFLDKSDSTTKVTIIDYKGKIKNTFPLSNRKNFLDEGLLTPLSFEADQSITAIGINELTSFSSTGRIKSTFPMPKNFIQQNSNSTYYNRLENDLILWHTDIVNLSNKDLKKFANISVLETLNLENGESKPLFKIPNISIFRNEKYFHKGDWLPVFTLEKYEIHIVFGIEPVIYTFKKNYPNIPIKSTSIHLKSYQHFNGYDNYSSTLSSISHPFSSGKILSIQKINSNFLITYFPGFDPNNLEIKIKSKSTEELIEFMRKMKKDYPTKIAVIDSIGNTLADFTPNGLDINRIIIKNGELWIPESFNTNINKNEMKIYKIKLKLKQIL